MEPTMHYALGMQRGVASALEPGLLLSSNPGSKRFQPFARGGGGWCGRRARSGCAGRLVGEPVRPEARFRLELFQLALLCGSRVRGACVQGACVAVLCRTFSREGRSACAKV